MKILVTGANGFIGRHTVDYLLNQGHEIIALDIRRTFDHAIKIQQSKLSSVSFCQCDIRDEKGLKWVFDSHEPEAVMHLAAQSTVSGGIKDPKGDAETNVIGTINLVNLCCDYNVKRIVYAGSGGTVYGDPRMIPVSEEFYTDPKSAYGISKLAGEQYIRNSGISHAVLRYPNVYGPGQPVDGEAGVIAIFTGRMLKGLPCPVYGDCSRDYVHVSDVAKANQLALESKAKGIFNIGTGINTKTLAILYRISEVLNIKPEILYMDRRPGEIAHIALDATKAKQAFKWYPLIDINKGIRLTVENITANEEANYAVCRT